MAEALAEEPVPQVLAFVSGDNDVSVGAIRDDGEMGELASCCFDGVDQLQVRLQRSDFVHLAMEGPDG